MTHGLELPPFFSHLKVTVSVRLPECLGKWTKQSNPGSLNWRRLHSSTLNFGGKGVCESCWLRGWIILNLLSIYQHPHCQVTNWDLLGPFPTLERWDLLEDAGTLSILIPRSWDRPLFGTNHLKYAPTWSRLLLLLPIPGGAHDYYYFLVA